MFTWSDSWTSIDQTSWLALLDQQSRPSPFLSPAFAHSWTLDFAGPLRLGQWRPRHSEKLDGLIFFHQAPGPTWQLVGGQEVADRLGAIIRPGLEYDFWKDLYQETRSWSAPIDLPNIDGQDPLLKLGLGQARQTDVAPFTLLSGFDDYLGGLSKKQRHELRRKRRRLEELPATQLLWVETPHQLGRWFPEFARLHRLSHPEKETFLNAKMESFFLELLTAMAMERRLQLAFLTHQEQAIASMLHFKSPGCLELYNSGFDPQYREVGPGFVLLTYCIEWACQQGYHEYNFLRGNERYKYDLGGQDRQVFRVHWPAGSD